MTALAFNLEQPVTVMKDGKELRFTKSMIKDSTNEMAVLTSESLIE